MFLTFLQYHPYPAYHSYNHLYIHASSIISSSLLSSLSLSSFLYLHPYIFIFIPILTPIHTFSSLYPYLCPYILIPTHPNPYYHPYLSSPHPQPYLHPYLYFRSHVSIPISFQSINPFLISIPIFNTSLSTSSFPSTFSS